MPPKPNQRRRDELLDRLEAIVLEEGFEHLRIGALADRLHCSRSTLYKLADSKEELIALIFERFADRAIHEATETADRLAVPAEKIFCYSDVIDRYQAMGSAQFWRDVRAHPAVARSLDIRRAHGYRQVKRFLEEGIAKGDFRPANTAFVGHLVWLGASVTRDVDLLDRLGVDRATANHEFMQLLLYGMAKPPADEKTQN